MQANKRDLEPLTAAAQRERRKGTRSSIDVPSDRIGTTMPFRANYWLRWRAILASVTATSSEPP